MTSTDKARKRGVDQSCIDLAEHFLQDEPHTDKDVADLSECIQDIVEDWFFIRKARDSGP